jgi:hypothetical protein
MKYTRYQVLAFIDNTNSNSGTHVALTDEPIRCDTWTETDPVTGLPVEAQWCPIPDGAGDGYQEFIYRMAMEYALRTFENPNQSMIYYDMSADLRAAWVAASPSVRLNIRTNSWVKYSLIYDKNPAIMAEVETYKAKKARKSKKA